MVAPVRRRAGVLRRLGAPEPGTRVRPQGPGDRSAGRGVRGDRHASRARGTSRTTWRSASTSSTSRPGRRSRRRWRRRRSSARGCWPARCRRRSRRSSRTFGVPLFPGASGDMHIMCSCPDWGEPCKHAAAVLYLLAEAFDDDPFLILAWNGRTKERLLAGLRRHDAAQATAAADPLEIEEAPLDGTPGRLLGPRRRTRPPARSPDAGGPAAPAARPAEGQGPPPGPARGPAPRVRRLGGAVTTGHPRPR